MKATHKKWLKRVLFVLGGALAGLVYYRLAGCPTGSCAIVSSPVNSMLFMAVLGWFLSDVVGKECDGGCDM